MQLLLYIMANIDMTLLSECIKGNSSAQYRLYELSYSTMKSTCLRYLHNNQDISDAINRSFLKVINSLESFDQLRSYDAWLRRIVINTVLDQLRKENRRIKTRDLDEITQLKGHNNNLSVSNSAELAFEAQDLHDMLKSLPEKTRAVFNLFAIDGYSHKEISSTLDMSEGNSKWHVHKAREILRKMILSKNAINRIKK